jgi:hypothetical protein
MGSHYVTIEHGCQAFSELLDGAPGELAFRGVNQPILTLRRPEQATRPHCGRWRFRTDVYGRIAAFSAHIR